MRNKVGVGRWALRSTNERLLQWNEGYFVIALLSYFEDRARTIRQLAPRTRGPDPDMATGRHRLGAEYR